LGYNYTEGTPGLRSMIAAWYPGAEMENVLVTNGTSEANFVTLWTLCNAGDGLAFMLPNFLQSLGLVRALGLEVRPFHLRLETEWRLDLDSLQAAAESGVKLIVLCNPNNPTGAVLSDFEMNAIVECARSADAWLLVDEIYRGSEIGTRPETESFWGRYEKTIITSSTSKSLAHAGLRIGWLVAPADLVAEVVRRQDYTTIGTGPINQYLAEKLLQPSHRQELLDRSREILSRNLAIIDDWVGRWNDRLDYRPPQAGGMTFVHYDFSIGSAELSGLIRERESTFVVAGDWFGMDSYLRIGIGGESEKLVEGLHRIDRVLMSL
jgi:aspartate/methionine/tyrosine aminotransferase